MKLVPHLLHLLPIVSLGAAPVVRIVAPSASSPVFSVFASATSVPASVASMPRLGHNSPDTLVAFGVGSWAWPRSMDCNQDGIMGLVVICTDKLSDGTRFVENSGRMDPQLKLPILHPAVINGKSALPTDISYVTDDGPQSAISFALGIHRLRRLHQRLQQLARLVEREQSPRPDERALRRSTQRRRKRALLIRRRPTRAFSHQ